MDNGFSLNNAIELNSSLFLLSNTRGLFSIDKKIQNISIVSNDFSYVFVSSQWNSFFFSINFIFGWYFVKSINFCFIVSFYRIRRCLLHFPFPHISECHHKTVNVFTALFSHPVILTFLQIVPGVCGSLNWLPVYLSVRGFSFSCLTTLICV